MPNYNEPSRLEYLRLLAKEVELVSEAEALNFGGQFNNAKKVKRKKNEVSIRRKLMKVALEKKKTASATTLTAQLI
jgi:hypothetical protein